MKNSRENSDRIFSNIAGRYDIVNRVLSLRADTRWRSAMISCLPPAARVLDLCTGTGDAAIEYARRALSAPDGASGRVIGLDISDAMLMRAGEKLLSRGLEGRVRLINGDWLNLPFPDKTFDAACCAFGLRNVLDCRKALRETRRVLKDNGRFALLEFSPPDGRLLRWGVRNMVPPVGGMLSGAPAAYRYLADSIRSFMKPRQVVEMFYEEGFKKVECRRMLTGVPFLYIADKSE